MTPNPSDSISGHPFSHVECSIGDESTFNKEKDVDVKVGPEGLCISSKEKQIVDESSGCGLVQQMSLL